MIGYIAGGCIAVYVVAVLLRWSVKLYTKISGRQFTSHKVRYASIGIATIIAFLLSGFGEGSFTSPDYSNSWAYFVSGLIVFGGSLGYSYKKWKEGQQQSPEYSGASSISEGMDESPANEWPTYSWDEEEGQWWPFVVFAIVAVVATNSSGISAENTAGMIIGGIIATIMWLGEGFLTAITNPYYLGGLVIGVGTGWILRGAFET